MKKFYKIFGNKKHPIVIGVVHCAPLLGYKDCPGVAEVEKKFIQDMKALIAGGVDAIMIENNYDIPHFEKAKASTVPHLFSLCVLAKKMTKKPLGVSVLWNDYETALSIAKFLNFKFIRMPVFVDKVKTEYGLFSPKAEDAIKFRRQIDAEDVLIFADVQVKHAKHLIKRPLPAAVVDAVENKADGIIITGKWTGDAPTLIDVRDARDVCKKKKVPILLGSGITAENVMDYDVDALIVSTCFKENKKRGASRQNIFPWQVKFDGKKVATFMSIVKGL